MPKHVIHFCIGTHDAIKIVVKTSQTWRPLWERNRQTVACHLEASRAHGCMRSKRHGWRKRRDAQAHWCDWEGCQEHQYLTSRLWKGEACTNYWSVERKRELNLYTFKHLFLNEKFIFLVSFELSNQLSDRHCDNGLLYICGCCSSDGSSSELVFGSGTFALTPPSLLTVFTS